ncbi:hypothetical protein QFC22_004476 [Naganishia vaughanmartiniae]|uniref:Uncharacterized protein n=1 Tax=Naganishia vaughanmartiniae TaxID=1424756 RepID=A0ACC2X3J4_9TREE|nr:hypothetical protein QFC22_004476 [Naganishia vaughanmartiniae]
MVLDLTISQILDDLLVDQAGRIRSARNAELRSTDQFLVQIPAVRLRLQQSCPPSARTGIATSVASDTAVDIRLETLSMRVHKVEQVIATDRFSVIQLFKVKLGNLTVRGEQDLTKTSVHLGNSQGFRRPQADLDDNLRFDLRISNVEVQKSLPLEGDGRSAVSVGDIIIHTGSLGPALLCVIVMSWRASIAGLTRMPGNSSKSAIAQLAISQIIRGIRTVQDPQCLTSRFELLRHRKIPYITANLMADVDVAAREDPGWLALTLLRVVMKKRELNQHKINANLPVPPDIEAILEENIQTISGWRKQHLSRESIARVPFLRLQNSQSSSASFFEPGASRIDSAFVTELHIQMDDQRQGSNVELFVLSIQNINASHVENAEQASRHPSGRAAHCEMKTCKIRSHIYLLDRLQDLAPTLLFTRKALQSKQESDDPPSLLLEASNPESPRPYSAALQIQEMEFSVLATPLQVDMRVLDLQCMLSKNTARLSVTPDIANLNTTKTRVRLISLTSKQDKPSPQVALVVLELDKTRLSLCDVNHKAHPAPPRASIIVNAHHVLVHTRATPHLMHARIQEWLDSYKRYACSHLGSNCWADLLQTDEVNT